MRSPANDVLSPASRTSGNEVCTSVSRENEATACNNVPMGTQHDAISDDLKAFAESQPVFSAADARFFPIPSVRSIIRVDVDRISDSCGYGVPLTEFNRDMRAHDGWAKDKSPQDLGDYQAAKNAISIGGLPGVPAQ